MNKDITFNLVWFGLIQVTMVLLKRYGYILWEWPFVFIPTYILILTAAVIGILFWREKAMDRKIYKAEVRYKTDIH